MGRVEPRVLRRDVRRLRFDLPEGTVYPALHRLEDDGLVPSSWSSTDDAVDEDKAAGLDEDAAVGDALARFGSPTTVAQRFRRTSLALPALRELGYAVALMAFGSPFVAGDTAGVTYTADRCADFERFHPESPDCVAAASAHHARRGRDLPRRRRRARRAGPRRTLVVPPSP